MRTTVCTRVSPHPSSKLECLRLMPAMDHAANQSLCIQVKPRCWPQSCCHFQHQGLNGCWSSHWMWPSLDPCYWKDPSGEAWPVPVHTRFEWVLSRVAPDQGSHTRHCFLTMYVLQIDASPTAFRVLMKCCIPSGDGVIQYKGPRRQGAKGIHQYDAIQQSYIWGHPLTEQRTSFCT